MTLDFNKNPDGLLPAIIQDNSTKTVLMLGYMNQDALDATLQSKKVTFYSRSKKRLWTKGEQSGNFLNLVDLKVDCDSDTILIYVNPAGATCHKGFDTCWEEEIKSSFGFLSKLEQIISTRKKNLDNDSSYVTNLFKKGINAVAQKVGEEAVEMIIEAKDQNNDLFLNESADLLFHYLILLQAKNFELNDVVSILQQRHTNIK